MEYLGDLIKIFIPASIVLYGMYAVAKTFLEKGIVEKNLELKQKNAEIVMPIRLQAYERMTMFLERITPNNLLVRLSGNAVQVLDFQQLILREIRDEFNHNLSQQVYMSHELWERIRSSMNEVVTLVNTAAGELQPDEPAINLSKKIFEKIISQNHLTTAETLKFLKEEIQAIW
jgi:hypothetical protein